MVVLIVLAISLYFPISNYHKMFSWYKYLIVSLVFSHLGFWSGNLFLFAPFPDLCLLVPSYCFMSWCLKLVLLAPYVCYHILVKFR